MKRIVLGAAAAGGAAFALHRLARKGRAMHDHCHKIMRNHCGTSTRPASRHRRAPCRRLGV